MTFCVSFLVLLGLTTLVRDAYRFIRWLWRKPQGPAGMILEKDCTDVYSVTIRQTQPGAWQVEPSHAGMTSRKLLLQVLCVYTCWLAQQSQYDVDEILGFAQAYIHDPNVEIHEQLPGV